MKGLPELGNFKVYFVGNTERLKQESHMPIFALKTKRKLLRNPVECGLKVPILESREWREGWDKCTDQQEMCHPGLSEDSR